LGQHAERSGPIAASERRQIVSGFVLQLSTGGTVKDAEEKRNLFGWLQPLNNLVAMCGSDINGGECAFSERRCGRLIVKNQTLQPRINAETFDQCVYRDLRK
jgi:hypothetical protein